MKLFRDFELMEEELRKLARRLIVADTLSLDNKQVSLGMVEPVVRIIRKHLRDDVRIKNENMESIKISNRLQNGKFKIMMMLDKGIIDDTLKTFSYPDLDLVPSISSLVISIDTKGVVRLRLTLSVNRDSMKKDRFVIEEIINSATNESDKFYEEATQIIEEFTLDYDNNCKNLGNWNVVKDVAEAIIYSDENREVEISLLRHAVQEFETMSSDGRLMRMTVIKDRIGVDNFDITIRK